MQRKRHQNPKHNRWSLCVWIESTGWGATPCMRVCAFVYSAVSVSPSHLNACRCVRSVSSSFRAHNTSEQCMNAADFQRYERGWFNWVNSVRPSRSRQHHARKGVCASLFASNSNRRLFRFGFFFRFNFSIFVVFVSMFLLVPRWKRFFLWIGE